MTTSRPSLQRKRRCNRIVPGTLTVIALTSIACSNADHSTVSIPERTGEIRISPSDDLQKQVDQAAANGIRTIILETGTYAPKHPGQALLVLTRQHDGITITGENQDEVILTASNESVADSHAESFPAIVNHVILAGDGISSRTFLSNLTVTGANGFVSQSIETLQERYPASLGGLSTGMFFFLDGGAVKVFGNSAPQFENCIFSGNHTKLCGGAVSIEQHFQSRTPVRFRNCIFHNNHCPATGAAVDVLTGGQAEFYNCLFVDNIANTGMDEIARTTGLTYNEHHGSGALTVFPESKARVQNCTFTGNWNAVDDHGTGSVYVDSIFWKNDAWDESRPGRPYELDLINPATVTGCFVHGQIDDLRNSVNTQQNTLNAPNPQFDSDYHPMNPAYQTVGFRSRTQQASHHESSDSARRTRQN